MNQSFLGNLVERASGTLPLVRPRLRSRFEGSAQSLAGTEPPAQNSEPPITAPQSLQREAPGQDEPAPTPEDRLVTNTTPGVEPSEDQPLPKLENAPPAMGPLTERDKNVTPVEASLREAPQPLPALPDTIKVNRQRKQHRVPAKENQQQGASLSPEQPAPLAQTGSPDVNSTQTVLENSANKDRQGILLPAAPLDPPTSAASVSPIQPLPIVNPGQGSEAVVPNVEITIGRIEIKADPPPAQQSTRQERKKATVMSLEDYLQHRGRRNGK